MQQGLRVGVVTNDQGKYLVDSAFFRLAEMPTVEVTGGCFCCNYDDLNSRLNDLLISAHPDVIFAESVGSCADLVATVVKPLLQLRLDGVSPDSFSVFADARLLRRRLRNDPMPFSDDVIYIFDKQLEEAGLLVINKDDLLEENSRTELSGLVERQFPGKPYILQSSLSSEGVAPWVKLLQHGQIGVPRQVLAIDYERYTAGEAMLGWVDQELRLFTPAGSGKAVVVELLRGLLAAISARRWGIGHLKFILEGKKLSFTTLEETGWERQIPEISGDTIDFLINARIEAQAEAIAALISDVVQQSGVKFELRPYAAFQPAPPQPTYRME
jgi:Ni2+-binding GTPase involved in maturation of urease and hydrogenase